MILLITPSTRGAECADSLQTATGRETHWAQSLQEAATRLREQTYSAAVIDQFLLETDPEESDQMIEHLGTAFPVYINFAITSMERLLREVRSALHRRKREEAAGRAGFCGREDPRHRQLGARTAASPAGELIQVIVVSLRIA